MRLAVFRMLAASAGLLSCCDGSPSRFEPPSPVQTDLSVADATRDAFSLPLPNLNDAHRSAFFVGNSLFNQNWLTAPASVADRDGLGPLFNARSCSSCHFKDGRGKPPEPGEPTRGFLLRISVAEGVDGAPLPDGTYGDQLQTNALLGLPAEVKVQIQYTEQAGQFHDGEPYTLRTPHYLLNEPGYGPLPSDLKLSARVAPAVFGMGLLEAVPEQTLVALADPDDRDGDGISGKLNRVPNGVGRFGWKAEQPNVRSQVAAAFVGDMGITSALFAHENHTALQGACAEQASGGEPELSDAALTTVESYVRTLAAPGARKEDGQGRALFAGAGCPACHVPALRTGAVADLPELSRQSFAPYTDLLLHDLGEGLSDGRPSYRASGSEWRTAPLWGLGLIELVNGHGLLLHDGRARGVAEAILWHGGEAQAAQQAFVNMSAAERTALVSFVESL